MTAADEIADRDAQGQASAAPTDAAEDETEDRAGQGQLSAALVTEAAEETAEDETEGSNSQEQPSAVPTAGNEDLSLIHI